METFCEQSILASIVGITCMAIFYFGLFKNRFYSWIVLLFALAGIYLGYWASLAILALVLAKIIDLAIEKLGQ
jgi:uncharacterized membrane protein